MVSLSEPPKTVSARRLMKGPARSQTTSDAVSTEKRDGKNKKTSSVSFPHSSKTDDTLGGLQLILEGLQSAAQLAPIPYLADAASAALYILGTVQTTRDNNATLKQLATDAYDMIVMIYETLIAIHKKHGQVAPRLLKSIERLAHNLHEVELMASKLSSRTFMTRYLLHKADQGKVTDCSRALRSALDSFHLESAISTWAGVEQMAEKPRAPTRTRTLFTVTDNSHGNKYISGGGTIIQEHGLKIISSSNNTPMCMSPTGVYEEPEWLQNTEADVINSSSAHEFDTRGGGEIRIRHGVSIESAGALLPNKSCV